MYATGEEIKVQRVESFQILEEVHNNSDISKTLAYKDNNS